jgi:hypothetical protein
MNITNNNGVKKSNSDVVNGIRKLLGSFPRLNKIIELENKNVKIIINNNKMVNIMIKNIRNGFTISIPVIIPKEYPIITNEIRLKIMVTNSPIKSSFNRSDF